MDEKILKWVRKRLNDVNSESFSDEELKEMYIDNDNNKYLTVSEGWSTKAGLLLQSDNNLKGYSIGNESYTMDTKTVYGNYMNLSNHYKDLAKEKKKVTKFFSNNASSENKGYSDLMGGKIKSE